MLHIKFGFNWPSDFRGEGCLFIVVIYMYIAPGWGHKSPWVHFFSESLIFSPTTHLLQDFTSNDFLNVLADLVVK